MEKQKSKPVAIILIVVLLLISLGLGGYIVYDKFIKDETPNNEINNNQTNNEDDNSQQENNKEEVVTVTSNIKYSNLKGKSSCGHDAEINVELPYINSSKQNATKINNEIQQKYNDIISYAKQAKDENVSVTNDANIEYKYLIKNDILYLMIFASNGGPCNGASTYNKNYYYDIKNDKILTTKEAFELNGYNESNLNNYIDYENVNSFLTSFNQGSVKNYNDFVNFCDNPKLSDCGLNISGENLVPYFESNPNSAN